MFKPFQMSEASWGNLADSPSLVQKCINGLNAAEKLRKSNSKKNKKYGVTALKKLTIYVPSKEIVVPAESRDKALDKVRDQVHNTDFFEFTDIGLQDRIKEIALHKNLQYSISHEFRVQEKIKA